MKKLLWGLMILGLSSLGALAQDASAPHVTKAATTKFMKMPVLPQCMNLAAQEGDPMKGASVILVKMTAGCVVPWHWHTANERLYLVSGRAKVEMKDHGAESIGPGDYVFLAGKGVHQFTCSAACEFFDVPDGAFDIHYVKADGSEVPPDEALMAAKPKSAATAKPKTE